MMKFGVPVVQFGYGSESGIGMRIGSTFATRDSESNRPRTG